MAPIKGLSREINAAIEKLERAPEVDLWAMPIGTEVRFRTLNSIYTMEKIGEKDIFLVRGGRYFPDPTKCSVAGSKLSHYGSMIKVGHISVGGFPEIWPKEGPSIHDGPIVTSEVQEIL